VWGKMFLERFEGGGVVENREMPRRHTIGWDRWDLPWDGISQASWPWDREGAPFLRSEDLVAIILADPSGTLRSRQRLITRIARNPVIIAPGLPTRKRICRPLLSGNTLTL
jgi:hypothetical protein